MRSKVVLTFCSLLYYSK